MALVPALEAVAPPLRRAIAREASTRVARIEVGRAPTVARTAPDDRSRALAGRLAAALDDRDVRAAVVAGGFGGRRPGGIAVSIALRADGAGARWLNLAARGGGGPDGGAPLGVVLLVLALSLMAVLGVGLVFVRRLTRPLTALALAARAAGRGDRTARAAEAGGREMRAAASAFNDMQDRIARFEAERTRTLAALGHDLRTPITSLRIRAEMIEDPARDDMIRTLDEMGVMADGLVTFARGEGEGEVPRDVDLGDLLSRLCAARGAALEVAAPVVVRGRPVALGRAVGNLVDNAVRYGGGARVRLSAGAGEAVVTVDDDGPGIPEDRLAAMFEPFVRGETSRSAPTGGAGLGLSIARQVARAHGGSVALENRAGGGLRAVLRLPAGGARGG